jgi:cellobiose-specific phosphotransferase system component IIC
MGYFFYGWLYIITHSWLGVMVALVILIVVLIYLPAVLFRDRS